MAAHISPDYRIKASNVSARASELADASTAVCPNVEGNAQRQNEGAWKTMWVVSIR